MGITRDELKAKRLAAMGAVGAEMQASAEMYDRVVEARQTVQQARRSAESSHMAALAAETADLKEMAEEMQEFAQAAVPPTQGASAPSNGTAPRAVNGSAALDALQNAQPQPKGWETGDAYVSTHPER